MSASTTELGESEWLQLALGFMSQGNLERSHDACVRGCASYPGSAELRYLLGAQEAQRGAYDVAESEMKRALALKPTLHEARLQLGLLLVTRSRVGEALEVWQPLQRLDEEHPIRLFEAGLRYMVEDRFDDARGLLEKGIERNRSNEALNADMRRLVDGMERESVAGEGASGLSHVLYSGYLSR